MSVQSLLPPKRTFAGEAFRIFLCICPAIAAAAVIALSRIDAAATEAVFSQGVFPVVSTVIGLLARVLPFSLIAVLAYVGIGLAVFFAAFFAVRIFKTHDPAGLLLRYVRGLLLIPSVIFFIYAITCGPNYSRLTFAEQSGLRIRDSSADELAALCTELIERTAAAREKVTEDETGIFSLNEEFSVSSSQALSSFHDLRSEYPFLLNAAIAPKAMIGSQLLSRVQVTGFYSCYTSEPNVNTHMPDLELPFTMCHELAHTSGFMREDEANFIGYLACSRSENPNFRYSGLICALNYSMGQLYKADPDAYWELRACYSEEMNRDLSVQSAYWRQYEDSKALEVYTSVNDAFLKANQQTDGRQSYGRMVDLLLAEYRSLHELE